MYMVEYQNKKLRNMGMENFKKFRNYQKALNFFNSMKNDFNKVYLMDGSGLIIKQFIKAK